MKGALKAGLFAAILLAGCAGEGAGTHDDDEPPAVGASDLVVPPLRVGDTLTYFVGFSAGTATFNDETKLRVVEQAKVKDAAGYDRDAFLLRQGELTDAFWEEYWVDAQTYRQFKLVRNDNYTQVTRMASPGPGVPAKATWVNGTGPLERYLDDPLFEDANFFGIFGSDRAVPVGQPFNVTGNFWQRDETDLLENGTWSATPGPGTAHERWGEIRTLDLEAKWAEGTDFETIAWTGAFSGTAPLAVDASRSLKAQFGAKTIDIRLNATLLEFKRGEGKELRRTAEPARPPAGKLARGPAEMFPSGANDARLGFKFQEAYDTLKLDPTASQFFTQHTGSYIRYAHLFEVDTCGFYPGQEYPGCHWTAWFGIFSAPDDYQMTFVVEKYHGGAAAVAFTPVVPTEDLMDLVFEAADGELPTGPPALAVVVSKSSKDLPPRNAFPMDAVTIAGALDAFAAGSKGQNANRPANMFVIFLAPDGYEYYAANYQWLFPPDPELFPAYDDSPMELERRNMQLAASGRVLFNQNYDLEITHR